MRVPNSIVSRIAPTPSGYLHLGNGVNFYLTWCFVRRSGGRLVLRIDDCDAKRSRPEFVEDIFRTLEWLGIDWDAGPSGPEEFYRTYSQALRRDAYFSLLSRCKHVYNCSCSRSSIRKIAGSSVYAGLCRFKGLPYVAGVTAKRLLVNHSVLFQGQEVDLAASMGDFVLWTKDDMPAYQLVSLADDERLGITHIFRGEDLFLSSCAQRYLAQELGFVQFLQSQIFHHPLLYDRQGRKLAKSEKSVSLKDMREAGLSREHILAELEAYARKFCPDIFAEG